MRVNCNIRQHIWFGSVKIGLIFTTKDPASLLGWKDLPRTCYSMFRVKEPARIFLFLSLLHAFRYFFLCLGHFIFFWFTNNSLSPCTSPVFFLFFWKTFLFFSYQLGKQERPTTSARLCREPEAPAVELLRTFVHLDSSPTARATCADDDT